LALLDVEGDQVLALAELDADGHPRCEGWHDTVRASSRKGLPSLSPVTVSMPLTPSIEGWLP
jgi:hypothetical protein